MLVVSKQDVNTFALYPSQVKGVPWVDEYSVGHGIYPLIEGLKRKFSYMTAGHKELVPYLERES